LTQDVCVSSAMSMHLRFEYGTLIVKLSLFHLVSSSSLKFDLKH